MRKERKGRKGEKGKAERSAIKGEGSYPELVDITASTRIQFEHLSSPEQKYIVESMSGGVALIDHDRDGWPDIYFTNAQNVEMARHGTKARSALYHNNHDGTFTDVTEKAGVAYPCWAMGASVGDYNNDGWPDILVTCFGGVVLYRNKGDGTFADVTKSAGLGGDSLWATGAAFGDYDGDGRVDLFVSHYVDFHLVQKLIWYLDRIQVPNMPDSGIWEEEAPTKAVTSPGQTSNETPSTSTASPAVAESPVTRTTGVIARSPRDGVSGVQDGRRGG